MLSRDSEVPLHRQVSELLEQRISSGLYGDSSRMPTELDISRELGVSRSTLRLAFKHLEDRGLLTRGRGRGTYAKRRLPYPTDPSTPWIGIVGPSLDSILIQPVISGIESVLGPANISLRFQPTWDDASTLEATIRHAVSEGALGMLVFAAEDTIYSPAIAELVGKGYPICLFDRALQGLTTDCSMTDNVQGGHIAASHLISLGHERIAFVSRSTTSTYTVDCRRRGFRLAMELAGLQVSPSLDILGREWRQNTCSLLRSSERPTAVFALNDNVAMNLITAVREMGLSVPRDLSVVGFDGSEIGARFMTPLTSVRQNFSDIGRIAAEMLMQRIGGDTQYPRWVFSPPSLIVRQSCGAGSR